MTPHTCELPEYLEIIDDSTIKVNVTDWRGNQVIEVGMDDVVRYFAKDHGMAGCRTIGCQLLEGYTGDWRPIDNLAETLLSVFQEINIDKLRTVSIQHGLEPKF